MSARAWAWWVGVLGAVAGARELDPAACAARFDLQRDKIIRTEESREMGARYLSELDVGARAECLRLCCETDACDVFVYEEKGPGSCYLFNCGPPEDFRCKFTAHSNFSSGVLALSRRLAELQDQEQLAHHERELASLRSGTSSTSSTTTSTTTATPPPTPPPSHPQKPPSRCSRYQFECVRGGECIAVYNACDGVPQCADGSDEAPELGCPRASPASPASPAAPAPDAPGLALPDRWPHRLTQAQPHHTYNEVPPSSHIFSHKGGLLQETEAGPGPQYPPFEPPWPRRPWSQQQTSVESAGGWGGSAGGWGEGAGVGAWGESRRAWPVPPEPDRPPYVPAKTMPEIPIVYSSRQHTLRDGPKKGPEPSAGAEPRPPPATKPPPPPPPDHREEDKPPTTHNKTFVTSHKHKVAEAGAVARHLAEEREAGEAGEAGAVLLLVLGVLMTAALGALLGCRARAARRRRARGKPFAHDADYLVNGMYL